LNKNKTQVDREYRGRDVATLRVLGIFFTVMGALVLVATYETLDNRPALIVNVTCGVVLAAVGIGMILVSRRLSRG